MPKPRTRSLRTPTCAAQHVRSSSNRSSHSHSSKSPVVHVTTVVHSSPRSGEEAHPVSPCYATHAARVTAVPTNSAHPCLLRVSPPPRSPPPSPTKNGLYPTSPMGRKRHDVVILCTGTRTRRWQRVESARLPWCYIIHTRRLLQGSRQDNIRLHQRVMICG